jgi:hypothetical protein
MKRTVMGLMLLTLALGQTSASPFQIRHFSATMTMGAGNGMAMKVYKSGQQFRTDMASGEYTVADLAAHKIFMVMPTGMCMQMPAQMSRQPNPFAAGGKVTVQQLGTATLEGHACRIEQVTVTAPGAPPQTMKVWSATDLRGFPLRVEMQHNGTTMQLNYSDVSLAAPAASLFIQPANCRSMPGMPGR